MADGRYWLAFTPDTKPEDARAYFVKRFNCEPSEVKLDKFGRMLLVGPLGREDHYHMEEANED